MSHAADAFGTQPITAIRPEPLAPLPAAVAQISYDVPVAAPGPASIDRPHPVWGSLDGYRISCDGCGTYYEHPESARDALTASQRDAAHAEGWQWHPWRGFICPACQEAARQDAAGWAALAGSADNSEQWLAWHVEGLTPTDEGAYLSVPTPGQDMIRLRALDAAQTAAQYAQEAAAA